MSPPVVSLRLLGAKAPAVARSLRHRLSRAALRAGCYIANSRYASSAAGQQHFPWMVPPLLPGASTAGWTRSHQQRRLALGSWCLAARGPR
eukprot:5370869-Prymnesium_polylepis.1